MPQTQHDANNNQLDLSNRQFAGTQLGQAGRTDLEQELAAIAPNITHLILSSNQLYRMSGNQLAAALRRIPPHVTYLDLQKNDFGYMSCKELEIAFAAIPGTVVELLLGHNYLGVLGEKLQYSMSNIPRSVRTLGLQSNLSRNLLHLLSGIPEVTTLNLANGSSCGHSSAVSDKLIPFMSAIPRSVTSLDLSGTTLSHYTAEDLAYRFAELPPNLISINLSGCKNTKENGRSWTDEEWAIILHKMPVSVTTIIYQAPYSLSETGAADEPPKPLIEFTKSHENALKSREYIVNVLLNLAKIMPDLVKLIIKYAFIKQDVLTSTIYHVIPTVPTAVLEPLDENGQPETPILPLQPNVTRAAFRVSKITYPALLFTPHANNEVMELEPSLNNVVVSQ